MTPSTDGLGLMKTQLFHVDPFPDNLLHQIERLWEPPAMFLLPALGV